MNRSVRTTTLFMIVAGCVLLVTACSQRAVLESPDGLVGLGPAVEPGGTAVEQFRPVVDLEGALARYGG